jgi:acyl-CoA thioester hydrolase
MIKHTSEIRVRYADTDQMKQVYYGKYFEYFEQGRSDLLRGLGLPYSELEQKGFLLPVLEACARYKRPAHYDDLLRVQTTMAEFPGVRFQLDYTIVRENDQETIAEGYTIHSFINAENRRPTRPPELFLSVIRKGFEELQA